MESRESGAPNRAFEHPTRRKQDIHVVKSYPSCLRNSARTSDIRWASSLLSCTWPSPKLRARKW